MGNKRNIKNDIILVNNFEVIASFITVIVLFYGLHFAMSLQNEQYLAEEKAYKLKMKIELENNKKYCIDNGGEIYNTDNCFFNGKFFYLGDYIRDTNNLSELKKEVFILKHNK